MTSVEFLPRIVPLEDEEISAELLPELTLARQWELTPCEIARNVHAHPTLSEAIKEAAHGLEGHMLNM